MVQKFRIEGLKELDKALGQLPRATGKNVLRRVARKGLEPIIEDAKSKVHFVTGRLLRSLAVSTKLSSAQKAVHKDMFASERSSIEMFAGAGNLPWAHMEEFGIKRGGKGVKTPHPFLRPAWDAGKLGLLHSIKKNLWAEIKKAADRVARKKARAASRIG